MGDEQHVVSDDQGNAQKTVKNSVLDYFSQISNNNEQKRVKNGMLLIKYLQKNNKANNDDTEIMYALQRLIRGLGSSNNNSRLGFYATLVAFLQTIPSLNAKHVLETMKKQLQASQSTSKGEIGEVSVGQVLACGALIRSNLYLQALPEEQKEIIKNLLNAGKKRSYLALATSTFIAELYSLINEKQFKVIWPLIEPEILKSWDEQTLNSLYLLILTRKQFGKVLKESIIKQHLGNTNIFCEENVKAVCQLMLDIPAVSSLKHSGYEFISKELGESDIAVPFTTELDSQLIKPNRNKLIAVSTILRHLLPHLHNTSQIPQLLTNNFLQQILQYFRSYHSNNRDELFQEEMTNFFKCLENCLNKEGIDSKTKIAVIKKLMFYPGSFMFENITKSKILQQISRGLDSDGVKKLSKIYRDVIIAKKEKIVGVEATEFWINSERIYASQLLTKLFSYPLMQNELDWKLDNLKFLMNIGIIKHDHYASVGNELAGTIRDTFFRALDQKFPKLESMCEILTNLMAHLSSLVNSENYEALLRAPLTPEEFEMLQEIQALTNKLENKKKKKQYTLVFQILFLHMALHLFKDKELAVASIKELQLCYERVSKAQKAKLVTEGDSTDPEWIEVVIDLFLNLLSHNCHLLRYVINCIFPHLCKYMTPSSVHQILSVLDPQNGVNPLSTDGDSESDSEESSEEADPKSDDEPESDNEESDTDVNETINDKLRMAVRQALGTNGYQTDEESLDLDDMSDTEGEHLNEALAEAFKQFKPNKGKSKKQNKNEQTLTHFRVRVLDLIEIYLDSEPTMLSCLEIMLPLLQTLEFTIKDEHQEPLSNRVRHCLKKLKGLKKFNSFEGITDEVLGDLLKSLLEKGSRSAMVIQYMSNEISDCCIFIVKCSQTLNSSDLVSKKLKNKLKQSLAEIMKNATIQYFNQRDCLIPYYLFKSILQLNWDGNYILAPLVFQFVFKKEMRPFRRSQALELLKIFYQNRRIQGTEEEFKNHMTEVEIEFCNKLIEVFEEFCENSESKIIKERFLYHAFNLLKVISAYPIKNAKIDWKKIGETASELRSHITLSKDAKTAFNQLCAQLHIPNIVQMKGKPIKLNNDDAMDGDSAKSNQKKRKGENAKKLKKEAKALRMLSLSKGLVIKDTSDALERIHDGLLENVNGNSEKPKQKKIHGNELVDVNQTVCGETDLNGVSFKQHKKNKKRTSSETESIQSNQSLKRPFENGDLESTNSSPKRKKRLSN